MPTLPRTDLPVSSPREPMFNVPFVVLATLGTFVVVHAVRALAFTERQDIHFLLLFAFIPARYDSALLAHGVVPGGWGAEIWSFVTYAFIHGDVAHLTLNSLWLLAFGTAVARRFGALRFVAFFAVTAAAGAALHLALHLGDFSPMVGASAAISGCMAAAVRFMFLPGRRSGLFGMRPELAASAPAAPLLLSLRDPRVLAFLAVWFGLNLFFGASSFALVDDQQSVAWQAHIGGFMAGLLLFSAFDPLRRRPFIGDDEREADLRPN